MAKSDVVQFVGIKNTLKVMREIEPDMYKQLRKDIRKIGSPATTAVKANTPSIAPLSGMIHSGRTGWGGVNSRIAITPAQRARAIGSTTSNLVAIVSTGKNKQFGFNIADMGGRGSRAGKYGQSRPYTRNGKTMRHTLNGQGQAMISYLNKKPSRYVYPAIESKLPQIRAEVANSLDSAIASINRKLFK